MIFHKFITVIIKAHYNQKLFAELGVKIYVYFYFCFLLYQSDYRPTPGGGGGGGGGEPCILVQLPFREKLNCQPEIAFPSWLTETVLVVAIGFMSSEVGAERQ